MTASARLQLIFVLLQVGDVITTMLALKLGGYEANPLVARILHAGPLQGLIFAKLLALAVGCIIVWHGKVRLLRFANYFYFAIVTWNSLLIALAASALAHR